MHRFKPLAMQRTTAMRERYQSRLPNKTAVHFYKVSYLCFLVGMPNFWMEDLPMPKSLNKLYVVLRKIIGVGLCVLVILELGAFVTQNELTAKQETDLIINSICHPLMLSYGIMISWKEAKVKVLLGRLLALKESYNDPRAEADMLRKSVLYSAAITMSCIVAVVLYSVSAALKVLLYQATYTTIITAWPPVNEHSGGASVVRAATNMLWWALVNHTIATFTLVLSLTGAISYQFVNLQSYFCNLETIFQQDDLNQRQKERKYEEGLKTGIKMHLDTFKCYDGMVDICTGFYNGQIVFVMTMLALHMIQFMKPDRTIMDTIGLVVCAATVLFGMGCFFCNAGDITIEASELATAIYSSGWQHCRRGAARRVRPLLVIAMMRTQKPQIFYGLGFMEISYESYINLVKTSYSVFSVLY